jgi:hypothetical protein
MKIHSYFLAILLTALTAACKKPAIDYSTLHVYKPEEVAMLIDNAVKIEKVGESEVQKSENVQDSSITTTTTTVYRIYVNTDDKGKLEQLPDGGGTVALKGAPDPIIISTSCEMVCNMSGNGEPCNVTGCTESKRCGCSQGSCGNNCTTHQACHQRSGAMGFGRIIIF